MPTNEKARRELRRRDHHDDVSSMTRGNISVRLTRVPGYFPGSFHVTIDNGKLPLAAFCQACF